MIHAYNDPVIVAAVQYAPALHDVQGNLKTALQLCFEAAAKGSRIIVLPELCLSGFSLWSPSEASVCAQTRNGYQTEAFVPIAKRFNCHIVFGYVELKEGKLYNSAAIVGPSGLVGNAQKHNSVGADQLWSQPSESLAPIITTPVGRLGALICRDAANNYRQEYAFYKAEHRFYRKGSIDTIALLTNWGTDYAYPDAAWVQLSEGTNANVIVSNRVGIDKDLKYKGGSCVVSRDRRVWTHGSSFTAPAVVGGIII
jgi:predicted amidohydrolase